MILPATAYSPPNSFKPSRWLFESRPLREEPPAFLCAMASNPSVGRYLAQFCDEIITFFGDFTGALAFFRGASAFTANMVAALGAATRCQAQRGLALGFRLGSLGVSLGLARALGLCRGLARLGPVGEDFGDPHQRKLLAVTALAARVLTAPLLEGDHLGPTALLDHLGRDRSARHGGGAKGGGIAADH